jgi:predicted O-methyltransferase YrrM
LTQPTWSAVDRYFNDLYVPHDPALDAALAASDAAGLPAINVSPTQGKLLHLLARVRGASRILEIGTLAGYSTIWLARALPPGGKLITLEAVPRHIEVARANIERAGLADRVDLRLGKAIDALPQLASEAPFDFVFIDADKQSNPDYLAWALKLTKPGSLIVLDNVVRNGAVAAKVDDPAVKGVQRANEMMAKEPRFMATAIQTVGDKGYDGFAIALVVSQRG